MRTTATRTREPDAHRRERDHPRGGAAVADTAEPEDAPGVPRFLERESAMVAPEEPAGDEFVGGVPVGQRLEGALGTAVETMDRALVEVNEAARTRPDPEAALEPEAVESVEELGPDLEETRRSQAPREAEAEPSELGAVSFGEAESAVAGGSEDGDGGVGAAGEAGGEGGGGGGGGGGGRGVAMESEEEEGDTGAEGAEAAETAGSGDGREDGGAGGASGEGALATDGGATGGVPSESALSALGTGDVALIDTELAEHQRWGAASARVGAAGSAERAEFIVQQAGSGAIGGFTQGGLMGGAMGAGGQALELGAARLVSRLAGPALARSFPLPGVGAVIGGVFSAYDLATRDWGQTGETIGRFGEGGSIYEQLANSIAAVSEIIGIATAVLNIIAGVIGAISIAMWIISVLTVGVASPLAATLSTIAAAIGIATMVLDGINALVLQRLVTMFRALHTFTSQADPTDVEQQGGRISQAAAASAGFVGGMAGGLAGAGATGAGARRLGLGNDPPRVPDVDPPRAATGDGPTITADPPPPTAEGVAAAGDRPAILPPEPVAPRPVTDVGGGGPGATGPRATGVEATASTALPSVDPHAPTALPEGGGMPEIPPPPRLPTFEPLPDYGPELPGWRPEPSPYAPTELPPSPSRAPTEPAPSPSRAPTEPAPSPSRAPTEPVPSPSRAPTEPVPSPSRAPTEPAPSPSRAPTEPAPSPSRAPTEPAPPPHGVPAPGVEPMLPPPMPGGGAIPEIPGPPRVPSIEPLPDYGLELPDYQPPRAPAAPTEPLPASLRSEPPSPSRAPTELAPSPSRAPTEPAPPTPEAPRPRPVADDQSAGGRAPTPDDVRRAEILENFLTEVAERRRMAEGGGLVDPEFQDMPGPPGQARRRGDPADPGRSVVSDRVAADLRARARAAAGRELQAALLNPGEQNPRTLAAMELLTDAQLDHVRRTGELPRGVEFHHLFTVKDFPEFAHLPEAGVAMPEPLHREMGHAMDPTAPVEAGTYRDPAAETRPPFHEDPAARKHYRPRQADVASGVETSGNVTRDLVIERRAQLRTLRERARTARGARAERISGEIARIESELQAIEGLISAERTSATGSTSGGAPPTTPRPVTEAPTVQPRPSGEGGTRSSRPLTPQEAAEFTALAEEMGMPPDQIQQISGNTAYLPGMFDQLLIGPDILPLPEGQRPQGLATPANAALEPRAVLGHEIIGHREAELAGQARDRDWHEEFQASTRAALHTPGLSRDQMWLLTQDAAARRRFQEERGTIYVYTERGGATAPPSAGPPRPSSHFRPGDQEPSVVVDWARIGQEPTAPSRAVVPPERPGAVPPADVTPTGAGPGAGSLAGSGAISAASAATRTLAPGQEGDAGDRTGGARASGVSGAGAGTTGAPRSGETQRSAGIAAGARIAADIGAPGGRDLWNAYFSHGSREERTERAGNVGALAGGVLGGGPVGAYLGQQVGEGVARRAEDFNAGLERGGEPVVEPVNPAYPPPPGSGSRQEIADLQNRLLSILQSRAQAEQLQGMMSSDAAHHEANSSPLADYNQQTGEAISATQAHDQATAQRAAANEAQQREEGNVTGTLEDYGNRAAGLAVITGPLQGFTRFTSLAHILPDSPSVLRGAKRGILKMNQDGQDFLDALNGVDSAVTEQQTAQPERSGEIEANSGRLETVASGATEAQAGLSSSQTEGQALASRNDARASDSRQRESQAGGAAERLGGQADDTRTEIDSLTEQWRTWASAHRQARVDAMLQTRSAMLARGWQPREESQGVGG